MFIILSHLEKYKKKIKQDLVIQFLIDKMLMKQLDLTKKEKFLFKFKLEKQLKSRFDDYKVQTRNEEICLYSKDPTTLKKIETFLQDRCKQLEFEILQFIVDIIKLDENDDYQDLKDQIKHEIILKNSFLKQIKKHLENDFSNVYDYFKRKIESNPNVSILLVEGKKGGLSKISNFLEDFHKNNSKIKQASYIQEVNQPKPKNNLPVIQVDLQLSNQKIFFASLLKLFDDLDYTNFIIYDKNDKLFIKGVSQQVNQYKKRIKSTLKKHKMIIIQEKYIDDIDELDQLAKRNWELKIINFKQAQAQCRQIYTKFNLDQPLQILKQLKQEKSEFNTFIFLKKFEIQVRNCIIKISNYEKIQESQKKQQVNNDDLKKQIITQEWKIQVNDILIPNLKNKNISQLIQKTIQKEILKLNLETYLKQRIQRLNRPDSIVYKVTFDSTKKALINPTKTTFCHILNSNLQSAKLSTFMSLEQLLKIKGIARQFTIIQYNDEIYFIAVTSQFADKYTKLIQILQKSKIKKDIKIQLSVYYLMKDEIQKIKSTEKIIKIQSKFTKQAYILTLFGLEYHVNNLENIIQMGIKRTQSIIQNDYIIINKAEQEILKTIDIIEKYKKQFELDIKIKEIKDPGIEIRLENHNTIKINKLNLNDASSKIKIITNKQDLEKMKSIQWTHIQNEIKKINRSEIYDQDRFIYYINEDKFKQNELLSKIFEKNYSVAMYSIRNKLNEFILNLYQYMYRNSQLQAITLCCRNQNQIIQIQNLIKQLKNQKSFSFLLKQQELWCINQKNQLIPYNQKINQKIISQTKAKQSEFYLNQQDLELKQITHIYKKSSNILWSNTLGSEVNVKIANGKHTYVIDNIHCQFSKNNMNLIESSKSNEIQLTIALVKITIQNKKGKQYDVFSKVSRDLINQKKKNTKQYIAKINILGLDSIYKLEFSTDQSKMKKINTIKFKIKQDLKKSKIEQKIIVDIKNITLKRIQKLCENNYLTIQTRSIVFKDKTEKIIQIPFYGYSDKYIEDFKIQYEIIKKQIENRIPFPSPYWIKTNSEIQILKVQELTTQFQQIKNQFKYTRIKNLKRIQNNFLWKQYYNEKKALEQISGSQIKEMRLFHGTNKLDPSVIFLDKQEAFNINYSSENNVFGRGIYFAKQAKYSNSYAFRNTTNKSMLFCRVLVGQSKKLRFDEGNQQMLDTPFRNQSKKIRYQSITSYYGDSDIYVIYKNRRAYPEYLIEY